MVKGLKSSACNSASHQFFKDAAKNRVDDLQGIFHNLQSARKESRTLDATVLEEQVHLMLREWKAELNEPSPASSLQQEQSGGTFSSDICRLLHICEEEDDATSAFAALKPEPDVQKVLEGSPFRGVFTTSKVSQEQEFKLLDQIESASNGINNIGINSMSCATQIDCHSFFRPESVQQRLSLYDRNIPKLPRYQHNTYPPPSAFLGPKCALWDCPRPALGLEWCQKSDDYCSIYHSMLASSEGYPGRPPVVRPGGIGLKDNLLFDALCAKVQGKEVGIPECGGSATAKSPWNAPELFDLIVLECETIREWLFFDKPRRAFDSGNRKQRSLPDYSGRGWHESRKQIINAFGGLKRSYYMDPQPMQNYEWHLYEYEIKKHDTFALYRLEVKRVDGKKTSKGKLNNDFVADLQKQMGRLTAEFPDDKSHNPKKRGKANNKNGTESLYSASNALASPAERIDHETGVLYDYLVDDIDGYYVL